MKNGVELGIIRVIFGTEVYAKSTVRVLFNFCHVNFHLPSMKNYEHYTKMPLKSRAIEAAESIFSTYYR